MPTAFENLTADEALSAAIICCSTFVVIYADGTKAVIQLRDSPVDTALVALARGRPGDIVPLVRTAQATQTYHAYGMPQIDGYRWSPLILTSLEDDIGVTQQLGEILTKLKLDLPSDDVVDNHIIPRLENVLENGIPDVEQPQEASFDTLSYRH
ncbi:hypothetical protein F5877DRAFT_83218 [Lentinula edodes]|nr:hypothetical protein F5877DRAFT_83218 [Lentinula edodes]